MRAETEELNSVRCILFACPIHFFIADDTAWDGGTSPLSNRMTIARRESPTNPGANAIAASSAESVWIKGRRSTLNRRRKRHGYQSFSTNGRLVVRQAGLGTRVNSARASVAVWSET